MKTRIGFALLLAWAGCGNPEDMTAPDDGYSEASAGQKGVDYSWSRPAPSVLRADGYTFAARYLSYSGGGKNLSKSEADALRSHGVDVVVVWEEGGTDALDGYNRGAQDAKAAASEAAACGQPAGRPIYFAIDFDAQPSQQGALDAYFDGVASVIGRSRTGAYGGFSAIKRLFDAGKIRYGWQTYAWSYGNWDSRAQLRQFQNGATVAGASVDLDMSVAKDFGQWGYKPVETGPAPAVPPGPTGCGALEPGHGLGPGDALKSCDGRFDLVMQTDGNLVLYSHGKAMWASGTNDAGGDIAIMQGDGNLVVYDHHSKPVFATHTYGHANAFAVLQDDGNFVVYQGTHALWATGTSGIATAPSGCGAIQVDRGLAPGEAVHSCDGRFALVMQGDGNLVLYQGSKPLWATGTNDGRAQTVVMQSDGNLVVYPVGGGTARWASHTNGHPGASLAVQNDGNVVIYDAGRPLWASHTCCR